MAPSGGPSPRRLEKDLGRKPAGPAHPGGRRRGPGVPDPGILQENVYRGTRLQGRPGELRNGFVFSFAGVAAGSAQGWAGARLGCLGPRRALGQPGRQSIQGAICPTPRETAETLWPLCLYYLHKSFPTSLIETVRFYEGPTKIPRHIYQPGIKI